MSYATSSARLRGLIDTSLARYIASCPFDTSTKHSLAYALSAGRRWRPIVLIASAELLGHSGETVLPAAAAIEMIHAASVILDDLPSMDDANLRRSRPAVHVRIGVAQTELLSHVLTSLADQLVVDNAKMTHVPAEGPLRCVFQAKCDLLAGQMFDVAREHGADDRSKAIAELTKKGSALYWCACALVALLTSHPEEYCRLTSFGAMLGSAYQILDDVLDLVGAPEALGKPTRRDTQKLTTATLRSLSQAISDLNDRRARAIELLSPYGARASFLRSLVGEILPSPLGDTKNANP